MINEPLYDNDFVPFGYLKTVLEGTNVLILNKTQNFGSQPVPPYRVNDTYMNGTDIYICINTRLIGEFNQNDWAKATNYTDNTLAESKNTVFITQPIPPYKIGDLWTQGPNGELRRCIYTRTTGFYVESDWENATKYDSTQTTVEGGLVTTGTIQVVQGGTVAAGMTGNTSGDDAIRFWAGSTLANRNNAPFKVTQGGVVTASNINIVGGSLTWNNLNKPTKSDLGPWTTYIDNNGIYTGTLTANQVNAVAIDASSIKSGTISTSRLNSDVITTSNFSAQNIDAGKIKSGTLTGRTISGGSININSYFEVTSGGITRLTNNAGGYFTMGTVSTHPWLSGLNVSRANGIYFYSGSTISSVGSPLGNISCSSSGSIAINPSGNFNANGDSIGITANDGYVRITAGSLPGTDPSLSSNNCYLQAQGNVTIHAGNKVYVASRATSGNYSGSLVKTAAGDYSSKNIKKNIKKFKQNEYDDAIALLKKINIYNYKYKYKLYDRNEQYGFILDEVEELDNNKFFDITNEEATIRGKSLDFSEIDKSKKIITVKRYDDAVLDKFLLTICKAQQMQIDELKKEINNLKGGK